MKVPRRAPSGTGPVRYGNLLDDDGALHAGALVGLAVVAVGAGGVELVGHLLAGAVEVILVGDGVGVDAGGDVVLVEDDVVGERLVVDELDGLALGDGDLVGLFVSGEEAGERVRNRRSSTAPRLLLVFRSVRLRSSPKNDVAGVPELKPGSGNGREAGTHEEAELAVVTAELDGGGEGGGGEEDGGDTDDGSLRREEGSGGRNNVSDKTLQQREEISRLNSIGARPWAPRGATREPCDGRRDPERIRGRIEPFESIAHPGFRSDRASRGARLRLRDYLVSNCG